MPSILGLTGNIATGKTTVGLLLLALGAIAYIDADAVVHELYLPGGVLPPRIAASFGQGMLDAAGGVDRRELGRLVFADPEKLAQLETIVHPVVQEALLARLRALPAAGVAVLDAVKLLESGYGPLCQAVWIVTAPEETQLRRLATTRGLSIEEARERIRAQAPVEPRLSQATEVIQNDGSLEDLHGQAERAWARLQHSIESKEN